jgi:hypothetical protein
VRFAAEAHARRDRDAVAGVLWALVLYQALSGAVTAVGVSTARHVSTDVK